MDDTPHANLVELARRFTVDEWFHSARTVKSPEVADACTHMAYLANLLAKATP